MTQPNPKAAGHFDFDLGSAVMHQLLHQFDLLDEGHLSPSGLRAVQNEPGVYQLFLENRLVYVGKANNNVAGRLEEHRWKLSGRTGIDPSTLGFKALYIHRNWSPSVHEDILIRRYQDQGLSDWNSSGFGNNDPGRQRDRTITGDSHFDTRFPIDPHYIIKDIRPGVINAFELLKLVKSELPYIFRFETEDSRNYRQGSPKYNSINIEVDAPSPRVSDLLQRIVNSLPPGWQGTFLPGRLILYDENTHYPHALLTVKKINS